MLSSVQKGMIDYQVDQHVHGVYQMYVREGASNPFQKLKSFIEECQTLVVDTEPSKDEREYNFLDKKSRAGSYKAKLGGIFNPNFEVLQQLGIINSVRDKTKITQEDFPTIITAIRSYAIERAWKAVNDYAPQPSVQIKL